MDGLIALVVYTAAAMIAVLPSFRVGPRIPVPELVWFHATVTWTVVAKAVVGGFRFDASEGFGTEYYAFAFGPGVVAAVFLFARRLLSRNPRLFLPGQLYFIAIAVAIPFALFDQFNVTVLLAAVFGLPLLLYGSRPLSIAGLGHQARMSVTVIAAAITIAGFVDREIILGPCRVWRGDDKCSITGEILTSPILTNGNFAGLSVAILGTWALIGLSKWATLVLGLAIVGIVELSGSRSALVAVIVVVILMLLTKFDSTRPRLPYFALGGALVVSIVPIIGTFPPDFATNRGMLWERAKEIFEASPFFGMGPNYWTTQTFTFANYSPHNIWLELFVAGGIIAATAVFAAGAFALRSARADARPYIAVAFACILIIGVLEAPVQPGTLGVLPFAMTIPLLVVSSSRLAGRPAQHRDIAFSDRG